MVILSIIIPVFNKSFFTKNCLKDLDHLSEGHEIIVVDNGSVDNTAEIVALYPRVKYLKNDSNFGFAAGANRGYREAIGECIMFLNNDIRVQADYKGWTEELIQAAREGFLVGPTCGKLDSDLNFVKESNRMEEGIVYISGWNITANKEIWKKLELDGGVFSEKFGLAYFEDTDLGMRAKKLGVPMKIVEVPVVHFGKITSRQLNTGALYLSARTVFLNEWLGKI